MTAKQFVLNIIPRAFCCRATWGGYHIWEEGPATLLAWGKTPALAWDQCRKNIAV